jgi:MoxR-like ATPase
MGYPALEDEVEILKKNREENLYAHVAQTADARTLIQMQRQVEAVHMDEDIYAYIVRLAAATREHPLVRLGISPRGSIALAKMSQSAAWLAGRDYVVPSDVRFVLADVFEHRLALNAQGRIGNTTVGGVLADIERQVAPPDIAKTKRWI